MRLAALYDQAFSGNDHVRPLARAAGSAPVYHQYAVRIGRGRRDAVLAGLAARGISTAIHYPRPVHLQPAAASWGYPKGSLPHAEALAEEVLCLPMHPFLKSSAVERVAEEVASEAARS